MKPSLAIVLLGLAVAMGVAQADAFPMGLPACASQFAVNCEAATPGGFTIIQNPSPLNPTNPNTGYVYGVQTGGSTIFLEQYTVPDTSPFVHAEVLAADAKLASAPLPCSATLSSNCQAPNPGGSVVVTNSTSSTFINVDTPVSQRVDQYSTTLIATLNGGTTVFKQTFAVPFSDPAVQAAVALADSILTGDHASFGAPHLASTSTTLQSTQFMFVKTGESLDGNNAVTTTDTFGPATVNVGENQTDLFSILSGQLDINVNTNLEFDVFRNAVTTDTFLSTQTYDIKGITATATPEPTTWPLLLLGVGAIAVIGSRKRARASHLYCGREGDLPAPRILLTLLAFTALGHANVINEPNACAPTLVTPCMVADNTGPILISNPLQLTFQISDLLGTGQFWGSNTTTGAQGVYIDAKGLSLPANPDLFAQQDATKAAALLASGAVPGSAGGAVIVTNSTTSYLTSAFVDTPVAARVDEYKTTIEASLNGGPPLFSETFGLPFSDRAVQAAVTAADAILSADGAGFGSPGLVFNSTLLVGSQLKYVTTGKSVTGAVEVTTTDTFGPRYIAVGDNLGSLFLIAPGQSDVNVNSEIFYATDRNAITTSTYLTTQIYDISGTTAAGVPEPTFVPIPLFGLIAIVWWRRKRFRFSQP